jgi:hypothetical protein
MQKRAAQSQARTQARKDRAQTVNQLLVLISQTGRNFFRHRIRTDGIGGTVDVVSYFEVTRAGTLWFTDGYTQQALNCARPTSWQWERHFDRHFTEGGTLKDLVLKLAGFIMTGKRLPATTFGPWPTWISQGDLWGYGGAMAVVREQAQTLGVTERLEGNDA